MGVYFQMSNIFLCYRDYLYFIWYLYFSKTYCITYIEWIYNIQSTELKNIHISTETLRELLTSLVMIPERHPGCLSFLENLNKCDEINGKVEEPNQDYNGSDQNKQIEEPIKKESSKLNVLLSFHPSIKLFYLNFCLYLLNYATTRLDD